jgi:autotransporter-associated beta strand protein
LPAAAEADGTEPFFTLHLHPSSLSKPFLPTGHNTMLIRSALLALLASFAAATTFATTFTYPDPFDPQINEWNATSGIAAGDTVILQNAALYTSSVSPVVNSGTLQFDVAQGGNSQNSPYVFSLNLSGTGAVSASSGYTYLTGTNNYTGGTLVVGGASLMATTSALTGTIDNQGELIFQQDTSGTFSGTILGGAILERVGSGTVTLTGSTAPAFRITNDPFGGRLVGTTRSLQGDIENNGGQLEFNQAFSGTFNGTFGTFDTGNVYKTGAGDLTLTGNNRLQAAGQSDLFIENGRVVGAGAALDFNGTVTISAGAEMRIDEPVGGFVTQMATEIVGAGDVYKTGPGTIDMTQVLNDYGGLTTVAQGKIIYSAGQLPQSVATGSFGEIRMTGSGTGNSAGINIFTGGGGSPSEIDYPGLITGAGSVSVSGNDYLLLSGTNTYSGGTFVESGRVIGSTQTMPGPVTLYGGGGVADVEYRQNFNATVSYPIEGTGVIYKTGTGSLTFSGSSGVSGAVYAQGGRLVVNSSMPNISQTRVQNGATLAGSGTIGSNQQFFIGIEIEQGTLAPGTSAGIITTNDLDMGGPTTGIEWELTANTAAAGSRGTLFDGINLTNGNLTIDTGAELDLVFNSAGSNVNWHNTFWDANQSWVLIDNVVNPQLGDANGFTTIATTLDSLGGDITTLRPGAAFTVAVSNGDMLINYAAAALVPEPSSLVLVAAAGLGGLLAFRRR